MAYFTDKQFSYNFKTFKYSTQEISFLDMRILIGADRKLFSTLYRKPTDRAVLYFYSNPSLRCHKIIVFSQILRYNSSLQMTHHYKKNSILSQYLFLPDIFI